MIVKRFSASLIVLCGLPSTRTCAAIPCTTNAFHREPLRYALSQYFIFEVKFLKSVPGWLQTIIHRFDLQRCSASKYEICLDSHKQYGKFLGSPYLALSRPQADIEKFIQKAVHV